MNEVGKGNLLITNLKDKGPISQKLTENADCRMESLLSLDIAISSVCLLDPKASTALSAQDADRFDYILLGGILVTDYFLMK
jgi:ribosome biogenesis SPOUT family RNA methylase Rps3